MNSQEEQILKERNDDLQKELTEKTLELQRKNRGLEIEAALERIRTQSMMMQHSTELDDTLRVFHEQVLLLGIPSAFSFLWLPEEKNDRHIFWAAWGENVSSTPLANNHTTVFKSKATNYPLDRNEPATAQCLVDWKGTEPIVSYHVPPSGVENYFAAWQELIDGVEQLKPQYFSGGLYYVEAFMKYGCFGVLVVNDLREDEKKILGRFAVEFERTYRRFLDLQKAEEQAREAQIELSLERVRAKTMAMHNSQDVGHTVATMFDELVALGVKINRCGILIYSDTNDTEVWTAKSNSNGEASLIIGHLDLVIHPMLYNTRGAWKNKESFFSYELSGEDIINYYSAINNYPGYPTRFNMAALPSKEIHSDFFFPEGGVFAFTSEAIPEDIALIFKRFASVFGQTYRRYLDLQKAEAQAREAQIELSLERVRAKTMAMHNSQDVGDTVATMFEEVVKLGIKTIRCGIGIMHETKEMELWTAKPDENGKIDLVIGHMDMMIHPLLQGAINGWKNKKEFYTYELIGDDLLAYFNAINNHADYPIKYDIANLPPKIIHNDFYFSEGTLFVFSLEKLSAESSKIFKRFSNVFGQTYRRYLDLKKAEAQARQAQIEAAMEKVRGRALAMQRPEELIDVAQLLRKEMAALGVEELETSSIYIHDEVSGKTECWYAIKDNQHPEKKLVSDHMNMQLQETWVGRQMLAFYHSDEKQISIPMKGDNRKEWIVYCAKQSKVLDGFYGENIPERTYHLNKFSNGYMGAASPGNISAESWELLQRATSVFSLAYTRFSDLQQAEAQAREATIEAALEKVRGKAMAMHTSNDVSATASMVFTELRKLGINPIRCGVGLLSKDSVKAQLYSATSSENGDSLSLIGWVILSGHPVLENIYKTWMVQEDYYPELSGEQLKSYYELLLAGLSVKAPDGKSDQTQYGHFFSFTVGCLYAWSDRPYDDAEIKILKRFGTIIDLTFRRYMELQTSEVNAKDTVKQSALDRVRADIASMRTITDLDRITPLIWNELNILGVPFIRCGVFIMDDSQHLIHTFLSTPDGKAIAAFHLSYDTPGNFTEMISRWRNKQVYVDHWGEAEFISTAESLVKQGAIATKQQYLNTLPEGGFYLHFLPFLQGMLYVGNLTKLSDDEMKLIQSVADAFSTAYARYEDFNKLESAKQQIEKTLVDLKQAQSQLIQSEKMASLGELTAGIAHEIQNPLNFVNNFSDVNTELIEELKSELKEGNTGEVIAIANDIKANEEKINHHGKRADAIVKGMLQHSRTSTNQKEATNINTLADEYLRLAYHGLRAKDKSFNTTMKTDFDETIGTINVIPQDIGRVLLNFYNNAFYAVNEKKKLQNGAYDPLVSVSTKKEAGRVVISVNDNGDGIPQRIVDKIFQPFFTTKPTGQGTGLGLSLSYDIIKAHGGEIKVETKENEGTTFIINLNS